MLLFILSFLCYIATAILHIIIHRGIAVVFGKYMQKSFLVFGIGALVMAGVLFGMSLRLSKDHIWSASIPMSAYFFYLLLSATHFLFFMSFFYDAKSPSTKLLFLIRRLGPLTREEILTHFSDTETVVNRVNTLVYEGLLAHKGGRLVATPKAMPIARFMVWYRRLMKWERGG